MNNTINEIQNEYLKTPYTTLITHQTPRSHTNLYIFESYNVTGRVVIWLFLSHYFLLK
jgi:hypothetical protein